MKNSIFFQLFDLWLSVQTDLDRTKRWGNYVEDNPDLYLETVKNNGNLRLQSVLQHEYSLTTVANVILTILKRYKADLNELLILRTCIVHDQPEGWLKKKFDCPAPKKTQEKDLKEYLLFKEHYKHFPEDVYEVQEYAYLLQYALKANNLFPKDAKMVMEKIIRNHLHEAMIFGALETWEYLFYAYEGFLYHDNELLLTHVLRLHVPELYKYSLVLPSFREEIFTKDFEKWAQDFIDFHAHVPVRN